MLRSQRSGPRLIDNHIFILSVFDQNAIRDIIDDATEHNSFLNGFLHFPLQFFCAFFNPFFQFFIQLNNFILCRLPEGRGKDVHERLAGRGVFVRYYARGVLADYLRISVGTPADTDRLLASLIEALSETSSEA